MNAVRQRERSKTARHEAAHAAVAIYLGVLPDEIVIVEPEDSGYVVGWCTGGTGGAGAVMYAAGVLDGHGSFEDGANLAAAVPDPDQREEVLQTAAKIMATPQYAKVHKALRLRLQHTDRLTRDRIAEIAARALAVPVDVLIASVR